MALVFRSLAAPGARPAAAWGRVLARNFSVLAALGLAACGPRVAPQGPGDEGFAQATPAPRGAGLAGPAAREVLVGEMCPQAASGRAGVLPMFVRTLTWSANASDVSVPIERRTARQFSVLSWQGRRAGVFSVAGATDLNMARQVAAGAYAGASPCATAGDGDRELDEPCMQALGGCGLALSALEPSGGALARPFEEEPAPVSFAVGGACVEGDKLVVDIDGDGVEEAYPVATFLNPIREPADEVLAVPRGQVTCAPAFARRHVLPPGDPKHWRGLDLLGVVDVDNDGRKELILSYHYSERVTWAVYSATATLGRLELVGEAVPW